MNFESLAQSNILETLKLADAPEEKQKEAITDATNIIIRSAMERITDNFTDDEALAFEGIFGEDRPEAERMAFLKEHAPDLEKILTEESLRYKYLAEIAASIQE